MSHLLSWGNAYAEIEWARGGMITALWPLTPRNVKPYRDKGRIYYEITMPGSVGGKRILPAKNVFHIHGLGSDGLQGYSPIRMARQAIGLGLAAEGFGSRFFGNDARPGIVYEHPGSLSAQAHVNLTKSLEARHQGLTRRGR